MSEDINNDAIILQKVVTLKQEADKERQQFESIWNKVEDQAAQKDPAEWSEKEHWQSKIHIPLQAKGLESAEAQLYDIQRGNGDWIDIIGVSDDDRALVTDLKKFIGLILDRGNFEEHNGFCYHQASKIGTSYMKCLVDTTSDEYPLIKFIYRDTRQCLTDPQAVVCFEDGRYWMETYSRDLFDILADESIDENKKTELLQHLENSSSTAKDEETQRLQWGEQLIDYRISNVFLEVKITEFWGKIPYMTEISKGGEKIRKQVVEERVVDIVNESFILRNEKNGYGFKPILRNRIKRIEGHGFGKGFLKDGMGIQDLANSIVNLGFDTAKIDLPMLIHETGSLANPDDVELKPLGNIEVKPGKFGTIDIKRTNTSNASQIIQHLGLLDQFHQEATGVLRQSSGANTQFDKDETLGQTQIKLRGAQIRMIKIARDNAEDYLIPLLRLVWNLVTHKDFIKGFQALANRTIGYKDDLGTEGDLNTDKVIVDNGFEQKEIQRVPKLDLKRLGKLNLDFKPLGVINFAKKQELISKLELFSNLVLKDEELRKEVKVSNFVKVLAQLADIPYVDELIKTDEEKQEEAAQEQEQLQQLLLQQQAAQVPPEVVGGTDADLGALLGQQ